MVALEVRDRDQQLWRQDDRPKDAAAHLRNQVFRHRERTQNLPVCRVLSDVLQQPAIGMGVVKHCRSAGKPSSLICRRVPHTRAGDVHNRSDRLR